MKVWEGKQVVGFLLTWRLLRPQLQQQTTDKYIVSFCYMKSTFLLDNAEIKFRIHDMFFFLFALQFGRRLQKILRTLKIAKSIVSFVNIPCFEIFTE